MTFRFNAYKVHPKALVVNLGCGLDTAGHQADNGSCRFVNIDFPNICEIREQLVPKNEGEVNIASDLKDFSWMDKLDFKATPHNSRRPACLNLIPSACPKNLTAQSAHLNYAVLP